MADDESRSEARPLITCPHCGRQTPKGDFCAYCGRAIARQPLVPSYFDHPPGSSVEAVESRDESGPAFEPAQDRETIEPEFEVDAEYDPTIDFELELDALDDESSDPELVDIAEFVDEIDAPDESDYDDGEEDFVEEPRDRAREIEARLVPVRDATKRWGGGLAKALSIGGPEGDPIHDALERRGRRPVGDYRRAAAISALVVLVALLLNNAGIAILLSVFVVPALLLLYLTDLDLFEREPWSAILGALGAGFAIGLLFGTISAWLTGQFWISGASFYAGAAGFAARFAEAEGTPPIGWLLLGGMVIPAIVVIACAIAPVFMRRWPVLRNEVMDGLTLGAAAGCGYAAATTIVHFWPAILNDQNPGGDISDWTATLTGLIVLRPLIYGAFAALLCSAIWQYALDQRSSSLIRGVVSGVGGIVIYSMVDMLIQPAGAAAELLWHLAVIGVLWFVVRAAIRSALAQDALAFGQGGAMKLCPNCERVTPDGVYCAHCGAPLYPERSASSI